MAHDSTQNGRNGDPRDTAPLVETDRVYRLLADEQRRAVLAVLLERDGEMTLEDLRSRLADRVGDERHAGIRLHHVHLPKLAAAGLIEYDSDHLVVTPTDATVTVGSLV